MGDMIIIGDGVRTAKGTPVDYLKILCMALAWKN
jgi:hypothetical protein